MQLHSMLLAVAAGMAGMVAGRATAPSRRHLAVAAAAPASRCERPARTGAAIRAPRLAPGSAPEPEPEPEPEDGRDIGEAIAEGEHYAAAHRFDHNAIVGGVNQQGSLLAGATVIVTSSLLGSTRVAITDESGRYAVGDLPDGIYTVTVYYEDLAETRDGIAVGSLDPTHLDISLPPAQPWSPPVIVMDE